MAIFIICLATYMLYELHSVSLPSQKFSPTVIAAFHFENCYHNIRV